MRPGRPRSSGPAGTRSREIDAPSPGAVSQSTPGTGLPTERTTLPEGAERPGVAYLGVTDDQTGEEKERLERRRILRHPHGSRG